MIKDAWFAPVFHGWEENEESKEGVIMNNLSQVFGQMMTDQNNKFPQMIRKLIDMVLTQDKKDSLGEIRDREAEKV